MVKAPKLYFWDGGALHHLAGISDIIQLQGHILAGHSWEGYAVQQVIASLPPGCPSLFLPHTGRERSGFGFGVRAATNGQPFVHQRLRARGP
ncbi:MAG: DUF4143 domain-containing protein [Saprospiraceae bacterium]|nr:MAG: DUF4143 domain-containing protein [Saprospiraceae bacterium]